jgi:hypothetical protein
MYWQTINSIFFSFYVSFFYVFALSRSEDGISIRLVYPRVISSESACAQPHRLALRNTTLQHHYSISITSTEHQSL